MVELERAGAEPRWRNDQKWEKNMYFSVSLSFLAESTNSSDLKSRLVGVLSAWLHLIFILNLTISVKKKKKTKKMKYTSVRV